MRLGSFCWSYGGEGPRGLIQLLVRLGVPKTVAESIAFETIRKDWCGTDWSIDRNASGWSVTHDIACKRLCA
jgi:hypothetical protein